MGNAHFRDPATIEGDELPWQSQFLTGNMRNHYKRLSRVFAKNNVPQRQHTWSGAGSNMLEPFLWNSMMVEECGAANRAYEVDLITQFPNSLYRFMGKNYTGLIATMVADATEALPGDDKRQDRQRLGLGLLHDFGVAPNGPHGTFQHKEQAVRLLGALADFGFFDDQGLEKLPFWRNGRTVAIGDKPSSESRVYVTVYRRPLADGKGYKAIFVILNESDGPAELPLKILDPARILGGGNTLKSGEVLGRAKTPAFFKETWAALAGAEAARPVLMDFETGEAVARLPGQAESYGPVYVPYHDYRVLYGEFKTP
jgi:hypothetical protein